MLSPAVPLIAASSAAFSVRNTGVGRALTAPMVSFVLLATFSNLGWVPATHAAYDACARRALPLSICYGLLAAAAPVDSDDGAAEAGEEVAAAAMLLAFGIGALGTVLGSLLGHRLVLAAGLLPAAPAASAAALYCATYIGGSANFLAVASAIGAEAHGGLVASLLAADLGLMAVYLLGLTAASRSRWLRRVFPEGRPSPPTADRPPARPPARRPARCLLLLLPRGRWVQ